MYASARQDICCEQRFLDLNSLVRVGKGIPVLRTWRQHPLRCSPSASQQQVPVFLQQFCEHGRFQKSVAALRQQDRQRIRVPHNRDTCGTVNYESV